MYIWIGFKCIALAIYEKNGQMMTFLDKAS